MNIRKINAGSSIGVFSPSWIITNEAPEASVRAENYLRSQGFKVKHGKLWGKADAYRTGTPKARADEFNTLLHDPEVDILIASVGGSVTNGMLPYIDYEYYADNPKPVVGMSDVTALLMALYAKTGTHNVDTDVLLINDHIHILYLRHHSYRNG